jgi:exosortase H (IPTLxxWG-CTERM-specific)
MRKADTSEGAADESASGRRRASFALKFLGLVVVSYIIIGLPAVDRAFVAPFTASLGRMSAGLMRMGGQDVTAVGTSLREGRFAVEIRNGCNALEACIILISAIVAFPAPWKRRLIGAFAGLAVIQGINLIRIISLFVIARDHPRFFEMAHVYVWQTAMFLIAIALFMYWSRPREAELAPGT